MFSRLQRLLCCGPLGDARKPNDVAGPAPLVNADITILTENDQTTEAEVHNRSRNQEDTAVNPRQPVLLTSVPPQQPPRAQPALGQSCSQPTRDTGGELEQPARLQAQLPGPEVPTSTASLPGPQRRALPQLESESLNFDPLTRLDEQKRSSATQHMCASELAPLSPFVSPMPAAAAALAAANGILPLPEEAHQYAHRRQSASRTPQQQQQPHPEEQTQIQIRPQCRAKCPGQGVLAAVEPDVGTTMLVAAGSAGAQALTRHLMDSDEMPLSSSLSEPLLQSASPASNAPPHPHPNPTSSGSVGTAVTAHSGTAGGAKSPAAQVWTASTAAACGGGDGATRSTTTSLGRPPAPPPPPPMGPVARERKPPRASGLVERSGGSRLGRPELAVLGPAAAAATAASGPLPVAGPAAAAQGAGAGAPPAAAAAASGGGGGGAPAAVVNVGTRGGGALGVLGGMTRRLLTMVQDVGSVVSQVGFMSGSARSADCAPAAAAPPPTPPPAAADSAAVAERPSGAERPTGEDAAEETGGDGGEAVGGGSAPAPPPHQPQPPPHQQPQPQPQQPYVQRLQQQQQQPHNPQPLPHQPPQQPPTAEELEQWIQQEPDTCGQTAASAAAAAGGRGGGLYPPYVAARGSLRAGSDSGSAAVAAAARRGWEDIGVEQILGQYNPQYNPAGTSSTSRLPKHAARDVCQVAMMQMLHFGSTSGRVPLQHLSTLNVASLSREIRGLHWIGQGGGGAVFQGVWQGAPVAVKFMLAARPEHVDATALEAVVSLAVGHPNVVTTYSFDVTRLTEASFMLDGAVLPYRLSQQPAAGSGCGAGGVGEECSATALFNALMETDASLEPHNAGGCGVAHRYNNRPYGDPASQRTAVAGGGGASGCSRPASLYRVENLSTRVRRAQAAALLVGGSTGGTPTSAEAPAAAAPDGGGGVGGGGFGDLVNSPGSDAGAGQQPCAATGAAAPHGQQQQQQHHQQNAPASVENFGMETVFNSEEGFGDPDLTDNGQSWTVRHVLSYLKARPGMYMTHIIMEYCDRGSLLSAIKRGIFRMEGLPDDDGGVDATTRASSGGRASAAAAPPPPPPPLEVPKFTKRVVLRALLRTARDVAQGMCHLHANGIIHGDLKPGNVLLRGCRSDRRGFTALVSDFGLSKVTRGDKPLELNHWSTVTVMAPEVIMGRWCKASDVFSFGILLWQLLTGEMMPYGNATVQQVLMGVAQGVLKPEWPASAHPALLRLGRACLATSPEKRPSFEAIVKILIKIEQHIRNELRTPRDAAAADFADHWGNSQQSRSSGSENVAAHLNRFRSSAV